VAERDLILALDNGTQSLKALVFELEGNQLAKERLAFTPYESPQPGWAEQDPEVFWRALCSACQTLLANNPQLKPRLAGVALTCQRSTLVNLDSEGRVLRPAIVWLDQRRALGLDPLGGAWGLIFKLARLSPLLNHLRAEAESNWLRLHQPGVWQRTAKYLMLSGFLTYRLTGRLVDSVGCQVGYLPFDYKRQAWAGKRSWRWPAMGIEPEMLPELVPPGRVLGEITRQASEQSGIPPGLPLIAAASDKVCEVIGSGSLEPSVGCLSYGTTATINVTHERYIEPVRFLPAFPAAVPGYYSLEVMIYRGYWMVSWFKEEFGHLERELAELEGVEAEELFDRLVQEAPPGAMGLMLQPYWSPGIRTPGPEAKGAVIGFGDVHTRAHLYRSILEGLAYALRDGKERIERRTKVPITSLRISGGGSQSRVAMQATADIFGLPTARPKLYETSALGAAIDAAVGLGLHRDFRSAIKSMTRLGEEFEPNPKTHQMYDQLFKEVYCRMYRRLKPLYQKIQEITGYPADGA
jgi:sugar (pentulose or hexulose) kinase